MKKIHIKFNLLTEKMHSNHWMAGQIFDHIRLADRMDPGFEFVNEYTCVGVCFNLNKIKFNLHLGVGTIGAWSNAETTEK